MDVLYTTLPLDLVLEDKSKDNEFNFQEINYNGIDMLVEPLGWHKFRIIRLYSTDPAHYLDPDLQPGSIISN
ncbi:MAG: hypothetical protein GXY91_01220 [Clostridia bacterium]|nr:hypothetical protein [Clostridia bacterium]